MQLPATTERFLGGLAWLLSGGRVAVLVVLALEGIVIGRKGVWLGSNRGEKCDQSRVVDKLDRFGIPAPHPSVLHFGQLRARAGTLRGLFPYDPK